MGRIPANRQSAARGVALAVNHHHDHSVRTNRLTVLSAVYPLLAGVHRLQEDHLHKIHQLGHFDCGAQLSVAQYGTCVGRNEKRLLVLYHLFARLIRLVFKRQKMYFYRFKFFKLFDFQLLVLFLGEQMAPLLCRFCHSSSRFLTN